MAIRPVFASLILTGDKRVEFRRRRLAAELSHVVVYATEPVKAVVGYFEVVRLAEGNPRDLWLSYCSVAGIGASAFWAYYRGHSLAVAVEVGEVFELNAPVTLPDLGLDRRPPQSFRYLPRSVLDRLAVHMNLHGSRKKRRTPQRNCS